MYSLQNNYDKALAVFNDALAVLGDQARSTKEGGNILWGIAEVHRLRNMVIGSDVGLSTHAVFVPWKNIQFSEAWPTRVVFHVGLRWL